MYLKEEKIENKKLKDIIKNSPIEIRTSDGYYRQENRELRNRLEKNNNLLNRVIKIIEANTYNNPKSVINKIKELVHDYQSTN